MAASTALELDRTGGPVPSALLLVYPVTSGRTDWPSFAEALDARPLDTAMMGWFTQHTFTDPVHATDPRFDLLARPLDDLERLPATMVITAERDPLRDQDIAFAARLAEAGVPVEHRYFEGVPHEFFGMAPAVDAATRAQEASARFLRRALRIE